MNAKKPLAKLQKTIETPSGGAAGADRGDILPIRIALAQIESRGKPEDEACLAMLKSLDVSWAEIVSLSKTLWSPQPENYPRARASAEQALILREVLESLYQYRKRNHKASSLEEQLTLNPCQIIMLKGANMSGHDEAESILKYFSQQTILLAEMYDLLAHFVCLEGAGQYTSDYLKKLEVNPAHSRPRGYKLLFYAAEITSGERSLPAIKRFESSSNGYVKARARDTVNSIARNILLLPIIP